MKKNDLSESAATPKWRKEAILILRIAIFLIKTLGNSYGFGIRKVALIIALPLRAYIKVRG